MWTTGPGCVYRVPHGHLKVHLKVHKNGFWAEVKSRKGSCNSNQHFFRLLARVTEFILTINVIDYIGSEPVG